MEKIGKILRQALAKKGLARVAGSAEICFLAQKWGKTPFKPISFSNGVLKVSVTSGAAASELQMNSEDLVRFINEKIGAKTVRKLRIVNMN